MRRMLILLSASVLTLTACTTTNNGSPSSSSATQSQAPSANSAGEAPKVANPIDTGHFKQDPCNTIKPAQIAELLGSGATPTPDLNAQSGPTCRWNVPEVSQASVSVTYIKANTAGLAAIYEKRNTTFPFFQPMESINGYPTVAYGLADERSDGRCAIALGTSDQEVIDVAIAQSEKNIGKDDPCAAAHKVASEVLGNLRGAQ